MSRELKSSKRILISIIFYLGILAGSLFPPEVCSQAVMGARAIGLGQTSVALPNSEWAVFNNPALMHSDQLQFSFFGIRYYGLPELTDVAAAGSYPANWGTLGIGVHRYGFDLYSENRVRLGYKNDFQRFHYGVVINYNHILMGGGYGAVGAIGIDVGIAALLTENLWIAGRATNINQPEYREISEPLPRELAVGLSYQLAEAVFFTSEVVKDVLFPISYRGGIEVAIFGQFKGRAGISTEPVTFSGGFGYSGSRWKINIAAQNHIELGLSPGLDLGISL